jgi:two-component system, OmpR family, copper resistance phosphate regulon response regulator CusR
MRLLVIEDESKLAAYLNKGLTENGYVVDVARNGIDGRHMALEGSYDLFLLDVMLPGIDGFALLKSIRSRGNAPVLMLTARDKVDDRVRHCRGLCASGQPERAAGGVDLPGGHAAATALRRD